MLFFLVLFLLLQIKFCYICFRFYKKKNHIFKLGYFELISEFYASYYLVNETINNQPNASISAACERWKVVLFSNEIQLRSR